MKQFLSLALALVTTALFLSACGPVYNTEYSYVPPANSLGKMCAAQCIQSKNVCEQSCSARNQTCKLRAHQDALAKFEMYKEEQKRTGGTVNRSVGSFEDSYSCSSACGCDETYKACYTICGGQVIAKQVCVAFCNK